MGIIMVDPDDMAPIMQLGPNDEDWVQVSVYVSPVDGMRVVQVDTVGTADVRINLNDGELATARRGEDVELPLHSYRYAHRSSDSVDEELDVASELVHQAEQRLERATIAKVSELVREAYPDAVAFEYDGELNEMGLLHTYMRRIYNAADDLIADIDDLDTWDEALADEVDELMWAVSERDEEYAGDGKRLELVPEGPIRVVSLQRAPVMDGMRDDGTARYTTPYPIHVDRDGRVLQQDFWKGDPVAVVGFQNDVRVHTVNFFWHQVRDDPAGLVGKYLVVADREGKYGVYETAITSVEVREMPRSVLGKEET